MRSQSCLFAAIAAAFLVAGSTTISSAGAAVAPTLKLVSPSVVAGHVLVVSGENWSPKSGDVSLQLEQLAPPTPSGKSVHFPVGENGAFSNAKFPVRFDTPDATYHLVACQACDADGAEAPSAQIDVTVQAHTLQLDPPSAGAGEVVTASGEGWNTDLGPVSLFPAFPDVCDPSAALAVATPTGSFTFSVTATVPASQPGEYRYMAAQCRGGKVVVGEFAPFTITTPPPTTTTSNSPSTKPPTSESTTASSSASTVPPSSGSATASDSTTTAPPTSASTSPSASGSTPASPSVTSTPPGSASTFALAGHPSVRQSYERFGWLVLAVVAAALGSIATRFVTRRPGHGAARPPAVDAQLDYRPAPAPAAEEMSSPDRPDIRLLTEERYSPVISTEERP